MTYAKSDQALLILLQEENHEAYSLIYKTYSGMLLEYTAMRVDSFEDANDIIHDLFVQLWEEKDSLIIKHSFKAYLFFCLKRRILNYYRKNRTKDTYAKHLEMLKDSFIDSPESSLQAKELQHIVQNILTELPPKAREIYLLNREQHLSITEIATQFNISEQTVKNQLYRATSLLKSKFKHYNLITILLIDLYI